MKKRKITIQISDPAVNAGLEQLKKRFGGTLESHAAAIVNQYTQHEVELFGMKNHAATSTA